MTYYTAEQRKWIEDNYKGITCRELAKRFNERFDTDKTKNAMQLYLKGQGFHNGIQGNKKKFTAEQVEFVRSLTDDYGCNKIAVMFNEKFGTNITGRSIEGIRYNYGATTEHGSRSNKQFPHDIDEVFKECVKGNSPKRTAELVNRHYGRQVMTARQASSYKGYHRIRSGRDTRFKPGHEIGRKETYVVGDIKSVHGYLRIKCENGKWRSYAHVLWEKENGKMPDGYEILYLDGNPFNCTIENIRAVSRATISKMMKRRSSNAEVTNALVTLSELELKIKERQDGQNRSNGKNTEAD